MKYFFLALAVFVAGCTPDQVTSAEANAIQVLKSIKAGAAIAIADVKTAIDGVCSNGATVNMGVQEVIGVVGTQSGPNTSQNIAIANTALRTLNGACTAAGANPNDPALATVLKTAWAAYLEAKGAQTKAASAASKGT